jgi:hypothetical protein
MTSGEEEKLITLLFGVSSISKMTKSKGQLLRVNKDETPILMSERPISLRISEALGF